MNTSGLVTDLGTAVSGYLALLTDDQRARTALPFADEVERRRWQYTPGPVRGLPLGAMTPRQRQAVFVTLAVGLSEVGYNHVVTTMGLERALDRMEGFRDRTYGDLPGTRMREPDNYSVAVFDSPDRPTWSWRIGGHHLWVQFTVHDGAVSVTPAFFGAEPARLRMPGGGLLRPMGAEEDGARALLRDLAPADRSIAVISPLPPTDLVQENSPRVVEGAIPTIGGVGPGGQVLRDHLGLTADHDELYRYTARPKGLPAAVMSDGQREMLHDLVRNYLGRLAEPVQHRYEHVFEPDAFAATTFAWAGAEEFGAPQYFRIQGPRLLIEYNCAQTDANHAHSAWRDPSGDFGDDILPGPAATCDSAPRGSLDVA